MSELKPVRTSEQITEEYGKLSMQLGHNKYIINELTKQCEELMLKMLELNQENAKLLPTNKE